MKHQTCANCNRAFIGSDTNIGSNLCDDCQKDDKTAELEVENARLTEALENAKRVFNKITKLHCSAHIFQIASGGVDAAKSALEANQ